MQDVTPGTITVYSDVGCPWSHLIVHRLLSARSRLGLGPEDVVLDHQPFPLELFNRRPTPWRILSAEVPVVGGLDPSVGWEIWQAEPVTWPVTTLLAMEAVQAAKRQGLAASERLDRALRFAFFGQSRCISMRHVILEVADEQGLDTDDLADGLDSGTCRRALIETGLAAPDQGVKGSPHVFLPDGTEAHNPGIEMEWAGEHGKGFPVVAKDDPGACEDLIRRAVAVGS